MPSFKISQVARSTPYDSTAIGLPADDVQTAIDIAYASAANASRGAIICGFDGSAGVGRFLEFYANNPSNNNPFVVSEDAELIAVSISAAANSTGTVDILVNGSLIEQISLSASKKGAIDSLSLPLSALDELFLKVSSGTINRPTVFLFIRTLPSGGVVVITPDDDIDGGTF